MSAFGKKEYLQIGELAKTYNISVQALRYYHRIGFLKPVFIDPETNYRYYSRNQGFLIKNKQLLQSAGFSLTEIGDFLEKKSIQEITELYKQKTSEIDKQIQELSNRKKQIEFYLTFFNGMLTIPSEIQLNVQKDIGVIKLKHNFPQKKVFIRESVVFDYSSMMLLYNQLLQTVFEHQLRVTNKLITIFHSGYLNIYHEKIDIELCMYLPCDEENRTPNLPEIGECPEEYLGSCIHKGKYPSSVKTYEKMLRWIEKKGYKIIGSVRHALIVPIAATPSPQETIFEVCIPVEKSSGSLSAK
ncbi:MAG: MerR family transcriptional regulator [Candidatus Riflebacteria bacterium]|nr:MerR family transcriptional regulator [Candidatus Riflebacteria bacterium]